MTNEEKLRALADWFDSYDKVHVIDGATQVQDDLRLIASELSQLKAENEELKKIRSAPKVNARSDGKSEEHNPQIKSFIENLRHNG